MSLDQIRASENLEQLKPAIIYLAQNMENMSFGEFTAYKRTIEVKANEVGVSLAQINKIAEDYQIYGYDR